MIRKGFREILTEFEDDDLLLLIQSDPYFLHDFCHTLTESLNRYEEEEKYEECVKIKEAIAYLKTKK